MMKTSVWVKGQLVAELVLYIGASFSVLFFSTTVLLVVRRPSARHCVVSHTTIIPRGRSGTFTFLWWLSVAISTSPTWKGFFGNQNFSAKSVFLCELLLLFSVGPFFQYGLRWHAEGLTFRCRQSDLGTLAAVVFCAFECVVLKMNEIYLKFLLIVGPYLYFCFCFALVSTCVHHS